MKEKSHISKHRSAVAILLLSVAIVLNGCIPHSDVYEELSGDHFYRDESTNIHQIIGHLPGNKDIYSKVIGYNYNSEFIIAAQEPLYDDHKHMIANNLRLAKKKYAANSADDIVNSEAEADSILKHDPFYHSIFLNKINYWIIDNKTQALYGPFTKKNYDEKRQELHVPEELQIVYDK